MKIEDMIRGLVRAAEGTEERDGGKVWDDEVRQALEEARRRGYGLNRIGTLVNDLSVQPDWCRSLPIQQQSVLFLAGRGPDGVGKMHPCKPVVIAYRATVFVAAKYGRSLCWGEKADTFMSLDVFADDSLWMSAVRSWFDHHDELPKHYIVHLMHGTQIAGLKHPDERFRARWSDFYAKLVEMLHLHPETEAEMDVRLGDWGRKHWGL